MTRRHYDDLAVELVAAVEDVLRRRLTRDAVIAPPVSQSRASSTAAADRPRAVDPARAVYRARRDRDALFAQVGVAFGEPAWDILLDLYSARREQSVVSVSSACIASAAPPTTGLRHLAGLERRGLIERHYDPFDRRRCFVGLTEASAEILDKWFSRVVPTGGAESSAG